MRMAHALTTWLHLLGTEPAEAISQDPAIPGSER